MGDPFPQFRLAGLQPLDAVFIGSDECRAFRVHGPVDKLGHIPLDLADLRFPFLLAGLDAIGAHIPELAENPIGQHEHVVRRAQVLKDGLELPFDPVAGNGLAVFGTFLAGAVIIGIVLGAALGPIAGKPGVAASAGDEAAQREILAHILAGGNLGIAVEALLDFLEGFKADQPLMLGRA
nr:hypothetical protein [Sphingobium sp. OAS761]